MKSRTPQPYDADRKWIHAHLLQDGDMQFYGCLAQQFNEIAPAEFWKELRRIAEFYFRSGKDRARIAQELVDKTQDALIARDQRFGYPPPFCHKGCSNCCHEPVYCTDEEANAIHNFCIHDNIFIDYAKLSRQLGYVQCDAQQNHTGITTWNDQPRADQACVFLDSPTGSCKIWPVRPLVCRVHLAEGTNQHCAPHNGVENPEALGIDYIELSYMLSVIFTVHKNSIKKTMGRLLLKKNANGGPMPG